MKTIDLTDCTIIRSVRGVIEKRCKSRKEIVVGSKIAKVKLSSRTVSHRLSQTELQSYIAKKKPYLCKGIVKSAYNGETI